VEIGTSFSAGSGWPGDGLGNAEDPTRRRADPCPVARFCIREKSASRAEILPGDLAGFLNWRGFAQVRARSSTRAEREGSSAMRMERLYILERLHFMYRTRATANRITAAPRLDGCAVEAQTPEGRGRGRHRRLAARKRSSRPQRCVHRSCALCPPSPLLRLSQPYGFCGRVSGKQSMQLLPIAAPSASSSRPLSSFMVCSSRSSRRPSPSTRDSGPGQVRRRYDPHNLLLRAAAASNILPQEGERAYCRQKPLAATNLLGLHAAQSQGIDCSAQQHQLYLSVHSNIGLARRAKPLDNAGTDFETRIPVAKPRPAARTRIPKAPDA